MSSSIRNQVSEYLEKHQNGVRLTLTAVAASVLTASVMLGYQRFTRMSTSERIKSTLSKKTTKKMAENDHAIVIVDEEKQKVTKEPMDETLVLELLARNIAFFGEESVANLRKSFVTVVGCGAVGSWATLMMVRSGIERVRVIDSGLVHLETMTRHSVAKIKDIGKPKVNIMKQYLADIAPNAVVETNNIKLTEENIVELLSGNPDFVIDTLPNVRDKVLLAKYCKENGIKIISAMSAGTKADPTLIQVTDITDTVADPLARMYRRQLRKYNIDRDVPCVYSLEKPVANISDEVPDFRTRSLPVLGPIASMFGLAIATYVIVQLTDFTAYKLPGTKVRDGVHSRLQKELAAREEVIFKNTVDIMSVNDVGYVFDELWQGKSVFSNVQDRMLVMTRWDRSRISSLTNTVVLTKEEAAEHDKLPADTDLVQYYGKDVVDKVEKQISLEKKLQELWSLIA